MKTSSTHSPVRLTPHTAIVRIVVPVMLDQRYDRGVSAAASLAERFGLPVRLVSVDLSDTNAVSLGRGNKMASAVEAVAAAHPTLEIDDEIITSVDHPASAFAECLDLSDLPVIATEAIERPTGSFAQEAVSRARCPVLLLGPVATVDGLDGDVVVAVDGSVLAERIIPAGRGLAQSLGVNVKLVQVVSPEVTSHIEMLKSQGKQVSENAYLRDLRERLGDSGIIWEIVHDDDPAAVLCRRPRTAAIAMATHGREGFVAQVFGSIALSTVRRAACPVLVQHPVDPASPIELS